MPNWVINRITLEGENIEEIYKKHFAKEDNGEDFFDFNTIEKMPEELDIENGSRSRDALRLYISKINPMISNLGNKEDKMMPLEKFLSKMEELFGAEGLDNIQKYILKPSDIDELRTKYKDDFDKVVNLGGQAFSNIEKYGCPDWYWWRINNWGTKWNACNTFICDDRKTFYFDTAWSPAIPLVQKFAEMYPDLKITHDYAEEQTAFCCGKHIYRDGEPIEMLDYPMGSKEAYEMSFDLWGVSEYYKYDETIDNYVHIDDVDDGGSVNTEEME